MSMLNLGELGLPSAERDAFLQHSAVPNAHCVIVCLPGEFCSALVLSFEQQAVIYRNQNS